LHNGVELSFIPACILCLDARVACFHFNTSQLQARRTLLMRHEAEIKSNAYWLGLLAHLQASSVPRKVKNNMFEA